ncbi:hypothetical protein [Bradyrhizobium yuanmingense]|uniref:hypothetical protein n=1 Tax=Bradyrhizobium yuanmingense TaxID=108015 RepID=UPI001CD6EA92|nr:hypothetical protein [Bradyrhizobium yuanmingense]MCA1530475.1 hypothetical protein [Bradyrhizobium yuanmingense]
MNRLRSGLIGQELSVFAFESEGGELDLDRSDKNHPRFVKLLDRDTMICFATMPMNDAGAPRASPARWFIEVLRKSAQRLAVMDAKALRMSRLLTVSQPIWR